MSRQLNWQAKKIEDGMCATCGKPRTDKSKRYCMVHLIANRRTSRRARREAAES